MLETVKKLGEALVALLCVWPEGSCKVKGEWLFRKVQREAMEEREQKSPLWQGSTLAGMMLFCSGKGFPLTQTMVQPPCVVNHDASTVSVVLGIAHLPSCSLRKKKLKCIQRRLFQKESPVGFDFRERSFWHLDFVALHSSLTYLLRESRPWQQLWAVGRGAVASHTSALESWSECFCAQKLEPALSRKM